MSRLCGPNSSIRGTWNSPNRLKGQQVVLALGSAASSSSSVHQSSGSTHERPSTTHNQAESECQPVRQIC
jgi:hypothetical protein